MTDAKGDRSRRPHEQANADSYVHIVERNAKGIVISGTKAIVTGAPYVHEFLVMPCRNMGEADAAFAVCCAVPSMPTASPSSPAPRAAGREGGAVLQQVRPVDRRRRLRPRLRRLGAGLPRRRMGALGAPHLQLRDAPSPHVHRCARRLRRPAHRRRGADVRGERLRPGRGDPPARADGPADHDRRGLLRVRRRRQRLRDRDPHSTTVMPDPVFSNIGKLLLANQIYEMHRIAHYVSGGLIVALPARTRTTTPRRRPASPTSCAPTPTCRTTSGSRPPASSRT